MENMKWIVLAIAVIMYGLVVAFQNKKLWFVSSAAFLVVVLGIIYPDAIFPLPEDIVAMDIEYKSRMFALVHSVQDSINWNVLLIYMGSMVIAALFMYSAVPSRIAAYIVNSCNKTASALVFILVLTGVVSVFVENVATLLVMAPIALALCKKINVNPKPFMVAMVLVSNIEGSATLIGDPASMVFASYTGFNFIDFFIHDGKLSLFFIIQVSLAVGCVFFYFLYFRKESEKLHVQSEEVVSWFPLGLMVVMVLVLAFFSVSHSRWSFLSGMSVFTLAAFGCVWYALFQKKKFRGVMELLRKLDWESVLFLVGIFVVVGAVKDTGLLMNFASFLSSLTGKGVALGFILLLISSVIVSSVLENVPFVIAMIPVASAMAENTSLLVTGGVASELYLFALLLGCSFGGNLTPFGANANIVAMGILKKENHQTSFKEWFKISLPFTMVTVIAASLVLWIIWA